LRREQLNGVSKGGEYPLWSSNAQSPPGFLKAMAVPKLKSPLISSLETVMTEQTGKKVTAWKNLLFRVKRELGVERLRRDAEQLGGLRLVARGGAERAFDRLAFGFRQRHGRKVGRFFDYG